MDKAAMFESMMESMQTDALFDIYSGIVTPVDRKILEDMPLPSDMVDPFSSQDVHPLSVMNLTYVSLSGWIEEARKEKYFTERFVSLSKLVMKGVTTMGRGLVTLHQRGEELTAAPMQIGDLISVGSYHFRKSYLGVVQFSAKHPEIGERLLLNQLNWSTTLLRLYKTKEKLAKPILNEEVRSKNEELPGQVEVPAIRNSENVYNEEKGTIEKELPDGKDNISSFLPLHSSFEEASSLEGGSSLEALSALYEPGAFSAHRAYAPLDGSGRSSGSSKAAASSSASLSGSRGTKSGTGLLKEAESGRETISKENFPAEDETEKIEQETAADGSGEERPEEQIIRSDGNQTGKTEPDQAAAGSQEERPEEQVCSPDGNETERVEREQVPDENQEEGSEEQINLSDENIEKNGRESTMKKEAGSEAELPEKINRITAKDPGPDPGEVTDPAEGPWDDPRIPGYLKILQSAFARSGPSEEGSLTFSFDEIRYLANDPDFARIYPDAASDMRRILLRIDSG